MEPNPKFPCYFCRQWGTTVPSCGEFLLTTKIKVYVCHTHIERLQDDEENFLKTGGPPKEAQ